MSRLPGKLTALLMLLAAPAFAQDQPPKKGEVKVPDLRELVAQPRNEMQSVVRWYEADRGSLHRAYPVPMSPTRHARLGRFHADWLAALDRLDVDRLSKEARPEFDKLRKTIQDELRQLNAK